VRSSPWTPTGLDGQQHGEALPEAGALGALPELVADDRVRRAQERGSLARDVADDPHREAGPRKRLPRDQLRGEAELPPHDSHLVLEELAQRLDQLEPHPLGKPPDVVVRLDRRRRPAHGDRLDHVRVERPLREEADVVELGGRLLEHVDEGLSDRLPLLLGISIPASAAKKRSERRSSGCRARGEPGCLPPSRDPRRARDRCRRRCT
jgi:hypothetical protein